MATENESEPETVLEGGGRTAVTRRGDVVYREAGPWSTTVHALLRHLEGVGFPHAPRVVGTGFDARGLETLTYIEGEFLHPGPWSDAGVIALGQMLRALHEATASFSIPENALWRPWFGRDFGGSRRVIGHCDLGPWNIVAREGVPVALIDWEAAGPVDPLVEVAQACWLNAQLHDDDVATRVGLPEASVRMRQVRLMADAYELAAMDRQLLTDRIIGYAVRDAANEAIEAQVTPESQVPTPLWAMAWRIRSTAWILRHRPMLEEALA